MTIEVAEEVDANAIDAGVVEGGGDRVGGTTVQRKIALVQGDIPGRSAEKYAASM